jgi:hypothetical protein
MIPGIESKSGKIQQYHTFFNATQLIGSFKIMTDLPLCTSDVKQEVKIRLGKEGQAALPPKTVLQCFDDIVERLGREPALFQKRPIEVRMNVLNIC